MTRDNPGRSATSLERIHSQILSISCSADPKREDADADLLESLKAREHGAFDVLLSRHKTRLLNAAHRITLNREDAEDSVQSALLQVHQFVHSFRGESRFTSWLTSIVINQALARLRKRRKTMVSLDECDSGTLRSPGHSPEELCLKQEVQDSFSDWLRDLNESYRTVAHLHFVNNCSCQEIASILGLSQSAVKSRLYRARRDLLRTGSKHFDSRLRETRKVSKTERA